MQFTTFNKHRKCNGKHSINIQQTNSIQHPTGTATFPSLTRTQSCKLKHYGEISTKNSKKKTPRKPYEMNERNKWRRQNQQNSSSAVKLTKRINQKFIKTMNRFKSKRWTHFIHSASMEFSEVKFMNSLILWPEKWFYWWNSCN